MTSMTITPVIYHGSLESEHGVYTLADDQPHAGPYCPPDYARYVLHAFGRGTTEPLHGVRPESITILPAITIPDTH